MIKKFFKQNPITAVFLVVFCPMILCAGSFAVYMVLHTDKNIFIVCGIMGASIFFIASVYIIIRCLGNWTIITENHIVHAYWFKKYRYELSKLKEIGALKDKNALTSSSPIYYCCSLTEGQTEKESIIRSKKPTEEFFNFYIYDIKKLKSLLQKANLKLLNSEYLSDDDKGKLG